MAAKLCTVVNIRDLPDGWQDDPQYVYIGRAMTYRGRNLPESLWANPHHVLRGIRTRKQSVAIFKGDFDYWVCRSCKFRRAALALAGKTLVCWCKEKTREVACHGDVIAAWVNEQVNPQC